MNKPNTKMHIVDGVEYYEYPRHPQLGVSMSGDVINLITGKRPKINQAQHSKKLYVCSHGLARVIALTLIDNPNNYQFAVYMGPDVNDPSTYTPNTIKWSDHRLERTNGVMPEIEIEDALTKEVKIFNTIPKALEYLRENAVIVGKAKFLNNERFIAGRFIVSTNRTGPKNRYPLKTSQNVLVQDETQWWEIPTFENFYITKDGQIARMTGGKLRKKKVSFVPASGRKHKARLLVGVYSGQILKTVNMIRLLAMTFIPIPVEFIGREKNLYVKTVQYPTNENFVYDLDLIWWASSPAESIPEHIKKLASEKQIVT